ncbi:hypothetical protein [Ralstonia pseudosolanacearum]|uniref:hypothetical protein n=1 Tax=Ralstonia pseudosolanacearum TaxID=1310165 RepID=UPI00399D7442
MLLEAVCHGACVAGRAACCPDSACGEQPVGGGALGEVDRVADGARATAISCVTGTQVSPSSTSPPIALSRSPTVAGSGAEVTSSNRPLRPHCRHPREWMDMARLRQVSKAATVEDTRPARNESKPETLCAAETPAGSDYAPAGVGGLSAS